MARRLRVATVQMRSATDFAENIAALSERVAEAALAGARLVASPENTGRLDRDRPRLRERLERADLEAETRAYGRLAKEHGIWLLVGSTPIPAEEGRVFNRSLFFDPAGKLVSSYDKIHLFEASLGQGETYRESEGVKAGARAVVASGPMDARVGLTICYDLRFPPLYKRLAQAGAEIIAAPAAFTVPTGRDHWEILVRARAIETGAFVLAPAQGGLHEDGRSTWGHSLIVGPWGEVLAAAPDDEPTLLVADLDLDAVAVARAKIPAWNADFAFDGP